MPVGRWLASLQGGTLFTSSQTKVLPALQTKVGIWPETEVVGVLGYDPSIGVRRTLWRSEDRQASLLGSVRYGYSYFREEQLGQLAFPVLLTLLGDVGARFEPQFTFNQYSGSHLACDLGVVKPLGPSSAVTVLFQPDYSLLFESYSGTFSLGASQLLGAGWSLYALGSMVVIGPATPLVTVGLGYLPEERR